jgi:hypothetical protein
MLYRCGLALTSLRRSCHVNFVQRYQSWNTPTCDTVISSSDRSFSLLMLWIMPAVVISMITTVTATTRTSTRCSNSDRHAIHHFCMCQGTDNTNARVQNNNNVAKSSSTLDADRTSSSKQIDILKNLSSSMQASLNSDIIRRKLNELLLQSEPQSPMDPHDTNQRVSSTNDKDFQYILQFFFKFIMMSNDEDQMNNTNHDATATSTLQDSISELVSTFLETIVQRRQEQQKSIPNSFNDSNVDDVEDTTSIHDVWNFINMYQDDIQEIVLKYMSVINYKRITPIALLYFSEYQNMSHSSDTIQIRDNTTKNGGTNRNVENWQMMDLFNFNAVTNVNAEIDATLLHVIKNDALYLAQLSYADTIDEIRTGLQKYNSTLYQYELLHCHLKSAPGQPAHFVAIRTKKDTAEIETGDDDDHDPNLFLDVILVIRGTKSVADAITDVLCDTQPYRNGMAHSYILDSGRYIANKYRSVFLDLLRTSSIEATKKSRINVTIYGHSLGAGTGAIAAMEINAMNDPRIHATMIGYGCPAILSPSLIAETHSYITTIIHDSDIVPRLSGVTLTNLFYDIIEFNWLPYAQRDIQSILSELQMRQPVLFSNDVINTINKTIAPVIESIFDDTYMEQGSIPRRTVDLFPPGKCIHIHHTIDESNNATTSSSYVPNWFYSTIDVNRHMIDGKFVYKTSIRNAHICTISYIFCCPCVSRPFTTQRIYTIIT